MDFVSVNKSFDMEIDLDEDVIKIETCDAASNNLDSIIGHIEDIVVSDSFQKLQTEFLDKNCWRFSNQDENKHFYMDIFNDYTKLIEEFIFDHLKETTPNIELDTILMQLRTSATQYDGEIFELLYSLSDFQTFKSLMLDFKEYKANQNNFIALDECMTVTKL